jgi:hypothetical protein
MNILILNENLVYGNGIRYDLEISKSYSTISIDNLANGSIIKIKGSVQMNCVIKCSHPQGNKT